MALATYIDPFGFQLILQAPKNATVNFVASQTLSQQGNSAIDHGNMWLRECVDEGCGKKKCALESTVDLEQGLTVGR